MTCVRRAHPQLIEVLGAAPILLSIALLPIGRTVEISTALSALLGLGVLLHPRFRAQLPLATVKHYTRVFLCFWLPIATSLSQAFKPELTAIAALEYLRFYFAGLWPLYWLRCPQRREQLWPIICLILMLWLLDSLWQWRHGVDLLGRTYNGVRLTGPFKDYKLPIVLILLLPMCLSWLYHKTHHWLLGSFTLMALLVIALSGQRAVWLDACIALIVLGILCRRKLRTMHVLGILLAVTLTLSGLYQISSGFKQRVDRTALALHFDYQAINTASAYRLPIWATGLNMVANHPLTGVGTKNFRHAYVDYALPNDPFVQEASPNAISVHHPHAFLLEIAAETGLIGLLGYCLASLLLIRQLKKCVATPYFLATVTTLTMALLPINMHTAFYGSFYSQLLWWLIAVLLTHLPSTTILHGNAPLTANGSKPSFASVTETDQGQHQRHFDQDADHGRQRRSGRQAE
ncbi:MAG: O-antigen ligase family protein [Methylococcales bacterium]|nr:O-antigen ligase family protein [Methylococcales bacterium]